MKQKLTDKPSPRDNISDKKSYQDALKQARLEKQVKMYTSNSKLTAQELLMLQKLEKKSKQSKQHMTN